MTNTRWLIRRLKAMSIPEVAWRLHQKLIQKKETAYFKPHKTPVTERVFSHELEELRLNAAKMHLNLKNKGGSTKTAIPLLGGYEYDSYKQKWSAGFQTEHVWPDIFSYDLEYKQRDDIGDARTNWELNRHFQFAILAKDYRASGNKMFLEELETLFSDWNEKNPFLWGISWTSAMEIAIRCSNWCYAYCFLDGMEAAAELQDKLRIGIINMADYIAKHYSRYSSANNHLIVEAYAVGQTGILCNYDEWIKKASEILTKELPIQNYGDGVNRELSLHYQAFYMEAMGLFMRLMKKNNMECPDLWHTMLQKMCCYVADCIGNYGEVIEFGDNDEGKILDLQGGVDYYPYVLGLFSYLLPMRYTSEKNMQCENLRWLFGSGEADAACKKAAYHPPESACYREGGNTILRSENGKILIGIDHAALGFGSIAAHGHADALSFQMYAEGQPIFVDPGTFIYHCDLRSRNEFRRTENHNTVCVGGRDQSEMLGPFLWGRKAECKLLEFSENNRGILLKACHNGYGPVIHTRKILFDKKNKLEISDTISEQGKGTFILVLAPGSVIRENGQNFFSVQCGLKTFSIKFQGSETPVSIEKMYYSGKYGEREKTQKMKVKFMEKLITTIIYEGKVIKDGEML